MSVQGGEKSLKKLVLEEQMGFLCEELGDPKRYFPYLRSKGTLDNLDCQSIRAQTTFKEQVEEMVSLLKGRQSNKGEHAFDVLVEALKQQRVQAHIARSLQKALAKAKEEVLISTPGAVRPANDRQLPQEESQKLPSLPDTAIDNDNGMPYEVHPLHGALPPRPADQSIADCSPGYDDQSDRIIHPTYGLLPPRGDHHVLSSTERSMGFSRSDSEPGGQSQLSSMVTSSSSYTDTDSTTTSTQLFSHDSSSSSVSDVHKESVEIAKLKAKVDDLVLKLEEAKKEIRRKDAQILSMQQQLDRAEREKVSKASSLHPYQLKLNGSDSQVHAPSGNYAHMHGHTYQATSPACSVDNELGGQPQAVGEGQGKPFSNSFPIRSKSSSPGASVSFV